MKMIGSKEFQLLCACARSQLDEDQSRKIRELAEKDINWEELVNISAFHKTLPLLYKSLKEACIIESERIGGGVSDDELKTIERKYQRAKRIKTEIIIQETAESFSITAFPAKITQGYSAGFGEWKINFPKK